MAAKSIFKFGSGIFGVLTAYALAQSADSVSGQMVNAERSSGTILFDFTTNSSAEDWIEQSDNVRTVGMSKAALVIQQTQVFRRAVFFSVLNPQPNGAGFAGMRIPTNLDLSQASKILMKARGQGNRHYKIVLRHKGENNEPHPTYENFFESPTEFSTIELNLDDFKPYYRGRPLNSTEADPLDTSNITSFGLQIYGGVYSPVKQHGPSALEIDWIKAE